MALLFATAAASAAGMDSSELRAEIKLKALLETMEDLEEIADDNQGTRASGTPATTSQPRTSPGSSGGRATG